MVIEGPPNVRLPSESFSVVTKVYGSSSSSLWSVSEPSIDLDDLLLLRFALRAQDKSRKIGAVLQIVDDYPIDLRSERSQYVCH